MSRQPRGDGHASNDPAVAEVRPVWRRKNARLREERPLVLGRRYNPALPGNLPPSRVPGAMPWIIAEVAAGTRGDLPLCPPPKAPPSREDREGFWKRYIAMNREHPAMLRQLDPDMLNPLDAAPYPAMAALAWRPPQPREDPPGAVVAAPLCPLMGGPPPKAQGPPAKAPPPRIADAAPYPAARDPPFKQPPPHMRRAAPAVRCSESM